MTTFTFAGVASSTIPELDVLRVRRPLVGDRRDDYVDVPGREGFWLFEEKAGRRLITIELTLTGATMPARRAAVIALANLLDTAGLKQLILSDEPTVFHNCRLASAPDPDEWLSSATFAVEFVAEPYSQAVTASVETWAATSAVARTFTPPDKVNGIPELEVTATGGTITSLTVLVNGLTVVYAITGTGLTAGQVLTISTLGYVVTRGTSGDPNLDGAFVPANLDMAAVSGDFGFVVPGVNSVTLTRTGTAVTIGAVLRWRQRSR